MPSEEWYDQAATAFEGWAGLLRQIVPQLASCFDASVVSGGRLQRTIEAAIGAAVDDIVRAAAELDGLSNDCRRQAREQRRRAAIAAASVTGSG